MTSSSRDKILAKLRARSRTSETKNVTGETSALQMHVDSDVIEHFVTKAKKHAADVRRCSLQSVSDEVNALYQSLGESSSIVASREAVSLGAVNSFDPSLYVSGVAADFSHTLGVNVARMAFAETGTLVFMSSPESPTSINFTPDHHAIILRSDAIFPFYEDGLAEIRSIMNSSHSARTINWIGGPSRSADIEATLELGAHGPKSVTILLVG